MSPAREYLGQYLADIAEARVVPPESEQITGGGLEAAVQDLTIQAVLSSARQCPKDCSVAVERALSAIEISREEPPVDVEWHLHHARASALCLMGEFSSALDHQDRARRLSTGVDRSDLAFKSLLGASQIHQKLGDYASAVRALTDAQGLATDSTLDTARIRLRLGEVLHELGASSIALFQFLRASSRFRGSYPLAERQSLVGAAICNLELGDTVSATEVLVQLETISVPPTPAEQAVEGLVRAALLKQVGEPGSGLPLCRESLNTLESLDVYSHHAFGTSLLIELLADLGEEDEMLDRWGESSGLSDRYRIDAEAHLALAAACGRRGASRLRLEHEEAAYDQRTSQAASIPPLIRLVNELPLRDALLCPAPALEVEGLNPSSASLVAALASIRRLLKEVDDGVWVTLDAFVDGGLIDLSYVEESIERLRQQVDFTLNRDRVVGRRT